MSELIPVGTHEVRIVSTSLGRAKTGTQFVAIVVEDELGQRLTHWAYLSDASILNTVKLLEDLGWDSAADDMRVDALNGTDRLVGKPCQVVVIDDEYNGETRRKVKYLNPPGGSYAPESMETDEAKALGADLRKLILAKRGGVKPSTSRGASKPASPATATAARRTGATSQADVDAQFNKDIPF